MSASRPKIGRERQRPLSFTTWVGKGDRITFGRKAEGVGVQIWVSMNLCRDFAQNIEGFFERVFKASGLPNLHMQLSRS